MREMTKSAVRVAREALAVGRAALPPYSGPHARHDYTQPQLLALLAVRQHLRVDYRGLAVLLGEWAELRAALGLRKVPHYSTLCDAAHRLLAGAERGGPSAGRRRPSPAAPPRAGGSAAPASSRSTPPRSTPATPARTTATATRRATAPPSPPSTAGARPPRRTGAPATRS